MRIPGVKTAKTISRWLQAKMLGGAMILGYHSIAGDTHDLYQNCVSPEHFSQHMEVLRRYMHPTSLSRLIQHLKDNTLPERAVVVTFDDGYADNHYHARAVLEEYDLPATLFVISGYTGKEFWWDELARLVIESGGEPSTLLEALRSRSVFDSPDKGQVQRAAQDADRRQLCHAIYRQLLVMEQAAREPVMECIRAWAGTADGPPATDPPARRALTTQELLTLTESGLVEIGAHTRTHPMLPNLTPERQREEIRAGKQDLEALLGREVKGFAYPNGKATAGTRAMVCEAGYTFACTSLGNVVRPTNDPYQLPRFWPEDLDGDRFQQRLKQWMKAF